MDKILYEKINENVKKYNVTLSDYACKDLEAIRYKNSLSDLRLEFQRDVDKIIYSDAYTRYSGKTQVYTIFDKDHISRRSTHVQYVSRVSRTIARELGLNEDLCEAISVGHDIGHVPFGHLGERFLNAISQKYLKEVFAHNVQSVRTLNYLLEDGKGLNLTVQVIDGILCHNGELLFSNYKPVTKTKEDVLNEYKKCYESENNIKKLIPMTLEGCVVRISDVIAYIGRDIEDAIRLKKLELEDLPLELTKILGNKNSSIMDTIILDIVQNSYGKDYICMSEEVYNALKALMNFNYSNIYNNVYTKEEKLHIEEIFNNLFVYYLDALKNNDKNNVIFLDFFNEMDEEYKQNTPRERVVIDFIAGMTDRYIIQQYDKYLKNK